MVDSRIIRRYNAYYRGWCLAFGDHEVTYYDDKDINWLFGENRVGLVIAPGLRKRLFRRLLRHRDKLPVLRLSDDAVKIDELVYSLPDEYDLTNMRLFQEFLLGFQELHLFLCSHFCYPKGTRIITFAAKKPLPIMYKEMQSLKVTIE